MVAETKMVTEAFSPYSIEATSLKEIETTTEEETTVIAETELTTKLITENQAKQKATTKLSTKTISNFPKVNVERLSPLQKEIYAYVLKVCEKYTSIEPVLVMAIIEQESNFNRQAVNYNGTCFGLMQVYKYYHTGRMEKLGVTDLFDSYGNILVGVDILSDLYKANKTLEKALYKYSGGSKSYYNNVMNKISNYC